MVADLPVIRVPLDCPLDTPHRGTLSVIGNLDGIHLGHQELMQRATDLARNIGVPASVTVFEPHPRRVLQPDAPPFLLTRTETKARILKDLGIDRLFVLPFNDHLKTLTPETFVKRILGDVMGLSGMITGTDFRFGAGRSGDTDALARLAAEAGMSAHAITPVIAPGGEKFSSSSVRRALQDGKPEDAARMLGRPFSLLGNVIEGRKLARTLDFPTANIRLGEYVRPKFGVYAVMLHLDGEAHPGIANIGVRPTVDGETEMLEVHLIDFDRDLYGQTVEVDLLTFIRPERKFNGLDALKAQITTDTDAVRKWHGIA